MFIIVLYRLYCKQYLLGLFIYKMYLIKIVINNQYIIYYLLIVFFLLKYIILLTIILLMFSINLVSELYNNLDAFIK